MPAARAPHPEERHPHDTGAAPSGGAVRLVPGPAAAGQGCAPSWRSRTTSTRQARYGAPAQPRRWSIAVARTTTMRASSWLAPDTPAPRAPDRALLRRADQPAGCRCEAVLTLLAARLRRGRAAARAWSNGAGVPAQDPRAGAPRAPAAAARPACEVVGPVALRELRAWGARAAPRPSQACGHPRAVWPGTRGVEAHEVRAQPPSAWPVRSQPVRSRLVRRWCSRRRRPCCRRCGR